MVFMGCNFVGLIVGRHSTLPIPPALPTSDRFYLFLLLRTEFTLIDG
jgi:hypothetical protein